MKTVFITLFSIFISTLNSPTFASGDHHFKHQAHDDSGHNHHGHENEANSSHINYEMAAQVGITTSVAGPQTLHQTITTYGAIVADPEQLSHVRARFEGIVQSVKVSIGDYVKKGDLLAKIESNESLQNYSIRSPISGRIVQRHANTGETTGDQILFSIANFDVVWAELRVYPTQQRLVHEGQSVEIITATGIRKSKVEHIVPSMDSPYQIARIKLPNKNHSLSPGLMIEARLEVDRFSVNSAVVKESVQTLGGRQGVFVKYGEEYRFTSLMLGRSDDHFYEVINGLEVGSEYVSKNSYLIKADIEKSEAGHEH